MKEVNGANVLVKGAGDTRPRHGAKHARLNAYQQRQHALSAAFTAARATLWYHQLARRPC